ncbi:uncharacterized protein STEHIDRAFT_111790 [Stereum hirsutum FP-91666 SS1]|uniref:uncharacterized protein n=1 Tax=Stereum hirsutum (strain FP-91666) TaxID=721885 RepID=UPI0004449B33|nr:uncharacterized protein STEHIDRAFT_111790 [Stereum hirsutum FP-91666 SS1]EIM86304.1 hypothetical protein STEHIDRAFT_111790 [Stereum hirsutum FP-91666 SS1]
MSSKNVVVVGGHGKTWRTHLPQQVALKLQSLIHQQHNMTSIIRSSSQITDLQAISPSIKTLVLSLEDSPVSDFTQAFQDADADVVVFSAGAGGQGGDERTKKVDYEGAVKVFDAIDGLPEERRQKTRLVIVSGIDLNPDAVPEHYDEKDKEISTSTRAAIGTYMQYKYLADKNLTARSSFPWFILRPSWLSNEPGTGKASIGRTHLYPLLSRDDLAEVLKAVIENPDAKGLAMDIVGGEEPIAEGVERFVKKGVSDWLD